MSCSSILGYIHYILGCFTSNVGRLSYHTSFENITVKHLAIPLAVLVTFLYTWTAEDYDNGVALFKAEDYDAAVAM